MRNRGALLRVDGASTAPGAVPHAVFEGMKAVFDTLPVGALLVDGSARILTKNRAASQRMRPGLGLHETDGRLRCDLAEDSALLAQALVRLTTDPEALPVALRPRRLDGKRALDLMLRPNPGGGSVTVFVSDRDQPGTFNFRLAQQLYGLSDREVDVARALVSGRTVAEAAVFLRVERETVRSHLKQLFSKTQTARQADVVRLFSVGLFGVGVET